MVYWKLDDETIRCLINKDEISKLGFNLEELSKDSTLMDHFLQVIIDESLNHIEWNTKNGVQNYAAKALPMDQFLITISCTYKDEAIDRDVNHIKRMFQSLNQRISEERLDEILNMMGSEKEKAFADLSKDLRDVYLGKVKEDVAEKDSREEDIDMADRKESSASDSHNVSSKESEEEVFPAQKMTFHSMNEVIEFASLLDRRFTFKTSLYRYHDDYILLTDFHPLDNKVDIITYMITAEEYGAVCEPQFLYRYFLEEHADLLIEDNAIQTLRSFG